MIRPGDIVPVTDEVLENLFASLRDAPAVLIAVSGGPDSVALMHLLARWRGSGRGPSLFAATVDHGLRPGSADDAALVAGQAAHLGIPHRVLAWTGPKPRTRVQETARQARYALFVEQARRDGATHLATAHTLDDQAETILMRLARGSSVGGLGGMRAAVDRGGIRHVRPLLAVRKAPLVSLCRREGWAFVEDPANADERFERARWRKLLPLLEAEGLTPERLGRLAQRAQRVEDALEEKARQALSRSTREGEGPRLAAAGLVEEPFEVAVRMLATLLEGGETAGPVPLQRLEAAVERLRAAIGEALPLRLTLNGRVIQLDRHGDVRISPEPRRRRGRYPCTSEDAAGRPGSLGKGGRHA